MLEHWLLLLQKRQTISKKKKKKKTLRSLAQNQHFCTLTTHAAISQVKLPCIMPTHQREICGQQKKNAFWAEKNIVKLSFTLLEEFTMTHLLVFLGSREGDPRAESMSVRLSWVGVTAGSVVTTKVGAEEPSIALHSAALFEHKI
jgi:hypothetical protein